MSKKVLIVLHELAYSGVPRIVSYVANGLIKKGHEVTILSAQQGPMQTDLIKMGCKILINNQVLTDPTPTYSLAKDHDVVFIPTLVGFQALYGANGAGKKAIWSISEAKFGLDMLQTNIIMQSAFSLATKVLFPSEWNSKIFKRFVKTSYEVINQGVPENNTEYRSPFLKEPNKTYVIQTGSIEQRKAQDIFVNAFTLLDKSFEGVIIGRVLDQNYFNQLNTYVQNAKLNIKFLGAVDDFTLNSYIEHSDIYVMPTRDDLPALSLQEAMLKGKPVVGSDSSGLPDVIKHEETGLLFENNNYVDLAKQINSLKDATLRQKLGNAGKVFLKENFNFSEFVDDYIKIITE